MESTIASAACGFNIKCTRIFRDKFGYICATDRGPVRLQRPDRSRAFASHSSFAHLTAEHESALLEYITFQHDVKEQLHESGVGVDRFLMSTQGTPYFLQGGECYIASYAQTCPNAVFSAPDEFLAVVAAVAQMHTAVAFAEDAPPYHAKTADAGKQLANLAVLKRKLLKTGKFSEFDMLFLKGCETLAGHIEKSTANADNPLDNARYFCHNLLKEENVYNDNGRIIITNFSECGTGHYLFDLAYLIKRCLKAQPTQTAPLDAVLDTYHKYHPAADFHIDDFYHILLYPDKFVKVTADYYSKKRSFAPKTYISRIEECLLANEEIKKYIG